MKSAIVVGSGPNGLAAAIVLARAGVRTTVIEAHATVGGGMRSAEQTLPGFVHDVCSAVHPLAIGSPFFETLPLAEHGLEWIQPPAPLAHPLGGDAVVLERSVEATASGLGADGGRYRRCTASLVRDWRALVRDALAPLHFPHHPSVLAHFGALALWPAAAEAKALFRTPEARALFAGIAAHSVLPLERWASSAIGWMLLVAGHAVGWPIPKGGSQKIADALASYFCSLGGEIVVGQKVERLSELRDAEAVLCDVAPRGLLRLAGDRLPAGYTRRLERFRQAPGVFKMDFALDGPIPWRAAACARAGTVHLGGTLEEIAQSERAPEADRVAPRPFVLLAQPSLFDPTRAPAGGHTAWAYCHVPNGSSADMTDAIESQIERFAPGFRARILAKKAIRASEWETYNPNLIGGDVVGGATDLRQLFLRPTGSLYRTPLKGLYLCSASTPPGGGVHGLCGYFAARAALTDAGVVLKG